MNFDNTEIFIAKLLFHYMGKFSIALSILWIGKVITNELFIDAYRVFEFEQSVALFSRNQKEKRKYLINRMIYLRKTI